MLQTPFFMFFNSFKRLYEKNIKPNQMRVCITTAVASFLLAALHSKLQNLLIEIPMIFSNHNTLACITKVTISLTTVLIITRLLGLLARIWFSAPQFYHYPRVLRCSDKKSRCVVCLCDGSNNTMLECGHSFHWACVRPWLDAHNMCPLCKKVQLRKEQTASHWLFI